MQISNLKYRTVFKSEHYINCVFWENDTEEQKKIIWNSFSSIQACAKQEEGAGGGGGYLQWPLGEKLVIVYQPKPFVT